MYHSIQLIRTTTAIFGSSGKMNGYNTWDNWHLIPSTRPVFDPPSTKTTYIDIPGANGIIDASEVLNNYPVYNQRTGEVEFYVMNGYDSWYNIYSDIMDYCHGRSMYVVLEDNPSYYYKGRVFVNKWKSEKDWSKIVLNFELDPFKYEMFATDEEWLWDPLSFEDGIIRERNDYTNISVPGGSTVRVNIIGQVMPVIPTFSAKANTANSILTIYRYTSTTSSDHSIEKHWTLPDTATHSQRYYDIELRGGTTSFGFSAPSGKSFTVSILYRGGRL